jgi:hypothetical protein
LVGLKKKNEKSEFILAELVHLADQMDVQIRREALGDDEAPAESGLAHLDGKPVIFLDRRLEAVEAVGVLVRELAKFRMDDIYIKPAIRKLFEDTKDGG